MGKTVSKLSPEANANCERLVKELSPFGDVTSKKMFGGYGVFESGVMLSLITADGVVHLKAGDGNRERFEAAGAAKHGRMPCFQVPAEAWADPDALREWAQEAIEIAHAGKK